MCRLEKDAKDKSLRKPEENDQRVCQMAMASSLAPNKGGYWDS